DRAVHDLLADLLADGSGDDVGGASGVVHAPSGAVAGESVGDVEALFEVVAEREVEEGPVAGGELHGGGEAALDDGQVADRQVAVQVVHIGADLDAAVCRQPCGVDAGPGDDDHPQAGNGPLGLGERVDDAAQQVRAGTGTSDGHDAHLVVGAVAELGPDRLAVGELGGVETGDVVAGKIVVSLGPRPDGGQVGAEGVGDDVIWRPDEDGPVPHPRVAVDVVDHLGVVVGGQVC